MSTKTVLSLILSSTFGLAILGNLFAGNLLVGAGLVVAVLGVGILSHLAFFEEKKKSNRVGPIPWINLAMTYGCLLLSLGSFLFLLMNPSDPLDSTIAKAGQSSGQETEGSLIPQSENTEVASGGERARLGNSGRGEGLDAMGGANADNQNSMREAQMLNPEIAGAEQGIWTNRVWLKIFKRWLKQVSLIRELRMLKTYLFPESGRTIKIKILEIQMHSLLRRMMIKPYLIPLCSRHR